MANNTTPTLNMRDGQVMLLATVFILGTLITASSVAALLAILQLRQTSDIKLSATAVGAADTAVEYALFEFFRPSSTVDAFNSIYSGNNILRNGAVVSKTCYSDVAGTVVVNCTSTVVTLVRGVGTIGQIRRAFELQLNAP